jgi:hypothetical protein
MTPMQTTTMQTTMDIEMNLDAGASGLVPPASDRVPAEVARLRRGLRETERPCGCKSGAALTLAALAAWPTWTLATGPPQTPGGVVRAVLAYPLVIVAAALAGKVTGIAFGRWRHRRLQRRLAQRLALVVATERG